GVPGLPVEGASAGRVELDAVHDDVAARGGRVPATRVPVDELEGVPGRNEPRRQREVLPNRGVTIQAAAQREARPMVRARRIRLAVVGKERDRASGGATNQEELIAAAGGAGRKPIE